MKPDVPVEFISAMAAARFACVWEKEKVFMTQVRETM
jgi:hypothetical protein